MGWKTMESAPKGPPFIALYDNREVHVCRIDQYGRVLRRHHQQRFPQSFEIDKDGRRILISEGFEFDIGWSSWTKGYEAKPTHWLQLPSPPETAANQSPNPSNSDE